MASKKKYAVTFKHPHSGEIVTQHYPTQDQAESLAKKFPDAKIKEVKGGKDDEPEETTNEA